MQKTSLPYSQLFAPRLRHSPSGRWHRLALNTEVIRSQELQEFMNLHAFVHTQFAVNSQPDRGLRPLKIIRNTYPL